MTENKLAEGGGLIAVPDGGKVAGAISYFRLQGSLPLADLARAWSAEGLDPDLLPDPVDDETALLRAVREQTAKRRLVRPLARRGSWIILSEIVSGEDMTHRQEVRVKWNGSRVVVEPIEADAYETAAIASQLDADYRRNLKELDTVDVSGWLVRLAGGVNAVGMRDRGGLYFIPRASMEFWRAVSRALQAASGHRIFRIPAMQCEEAVEAILDAVTQEAKAAVEEMESELLALSQGATKMGIRALKTRSATVEALLAKVQSYEALLGAKMPDVQAQLEGLASAVGTATLLAEQAADQAADAANAA